MKSSDFSSNISDGSFADVTKDLAVVGRGERNVGDPTTDVCADDGYAYTGTFDSPCGGDSSGEAGIWVWDVHNRNKPSFVGTRTSRHSSASSDYRTEAAPTTSASLG